jgi:hypothetical protein
MRRVTTNKRSLRRKITHCISNPKRSIHICLMCCKCEPLAIFNVDVHLVKILWAKEPQFEEIIRKPISTRNGKMSSDPGVQTRGALLMVAIIQSGKHIPGFVGQPSEHFLQSLTLQMGRVVVQLSGQRLQRVAVGSTDNDFPY